MDSSLNCTRYESLFDHKRGNLAPGYQFCGPSTKLQERLSRGNKGVKLLDAAFREEGKVQWTVYTDTKKYTQTKKKIYIYIYKDTIKFKD